MKLQRKIKKIGAQWGCRKARVARIRAEGTPQHQHGKPMKLQGEMVDFGAEIYGSLWSSMEFHRILWNPLESNGIQWNAMESDGIHVKFMEFHGIP